jgi:hypothetical protein
MQFRKRRTVVKIPDAEQSRQTQWFSVVYTFVRTFYSPLAVSSAISNTQILKYALSRTAGFPYRDHSFGSNED